jgi:hypothetical protein
MAACEGYEQIYNDREERERLEERKRSVENLDGTTWRIEMYDKIAKEESARAAEQCKERVAERMKDIDARLREFKQKTLQAAIARDAELQVAKVKHEECLLKLEKERAEIL